MTIKMERVWAMPSHRTFTIPPIKQLIKDELGGAYIDPFPYPFRQDAIEYMSGIPDESTEAVVFDPPYSQRQLREMYNMAGLSLNHPMNSSYWYRCRDEIARITRPSGKVISFGWNSGGLGKRRGFMITRILLVAHGGQHNDTICTVEQKIQERLL